MRKRVETGAAGDAEAAEDRNYAAYRAAMLEDLYAYRPAGLPKRMILLGLAAAALLLAAAVGGMLGQSAREGGEGVVAWARSLVAAAQRLVGGAPTPRLRREGEDVFWGLPPGKVMVHADGMKKLAAGLPAFDTNGQAGLPPGFKPLK